MDNTAGPAQWYMCLMVPVEEQETANQLAQQVTGSSDPAELRTYGVALSPTGSAPTTHYGCFTAATPAMLDVMRGILGQNLLPGLIFYRIGLDSGLLERASSDTGTACVGLAWTWEDCLANAGLQTVAGSLPYGSE